MVQGVVAPLKRWLYGDLYYGRRHQCPFCGASLRTFQPHGLSLAVLAEKQVIGGGRRPNARCPVRGSIDRERLLYLWRLLPSDATPWDGSMVNGQWSGWGGAAFDQGSSAKIVPRWGDQASHKDSPVSPPATAGSRVAWRVAPSPIPSTTTVNRTRLPWNSRWVTLPR